MGRALAWATALTGAQLALGLCLGCYYNYTFFGRAAGPLPQPVASAGAMLYYLFVAAGDTQVVQAWLWMLCFPLAGWIWLGSLWVVGRRLGGACRGLVRASLAGIVPLLLPLPYLLWRHALTPNGPSWAQFQQAALYRRFDTVPAGLPALFVPLAVVGLALEAVLLARASGVGPGRAAAWLMVSLGVAMLATALLTVPFVART
ncbi:MAG: hypothetical protein HZB16_09575 [Armatimonadetes bacterium]|nr:hypothetical protein [Armatimonadota bacterium]